MQSDNDSEIQKRISHFEDDSEMRAEEDDDDEIEGVFMDEEK